MLIPAWILVPIELQISEEIEDLLNTSENYDRPLKKAIMVLKSHWVKTSICCCKSNSLFLWQLCCFKSLDSVGIEEESE